MMNDTNYLEHFGIKGQKWGIRRFQNEDRTLTDEGKKRYGKYDRAIRDIDSVLSGKKAGSRILTSKDREELKKYREKLVSKKEAKEKRTSEKQAKREAKKAQIPESATWKSKEAKYLSDEELNRRNNRLQREKQYREMTATNGQKFIKSFKKTMGKIFVMSLVGAATGIMATHYKDMLKAGEGFISEVMSMPIDLTNLR